MRHERTKIKSVLRRVLCFDLAATGCFTVVTFFGPASVTLLVCAFLFFFSFVASVGVEQESVLYVRYCPLRKMPALFSFWVGTVRRRISLSFIHFCSFGRSWYSRLLNQRLTGGRPSQSTKGPKTEWWMNVLPRFTSLRTIFTCTSDYSVTVRGFCAVVFFILCAYACLVYPAGWLSTEKVLPLDRKSVV